MSDLRASSWVPVGGGPTGDLLRATDWSATALGPMARWSTSLRCLVQTILNSRHPMFLFWGPEHVQIYNGAYVPSFGVGKHPAAMGQPGAECWDVSWPLIGPQIDDVKHSGVPTWHEHALVPIQRNDRIEEVYWTYGYSPALDDDGSIGGALVVCTETTGEVLATRRLQLNATLARTLAEAENEAEVWGGAFACFGEARVDLPFVVRLAADKELNRMGVASEQIQLDPLAGAGAGGGRPYVTTLHDPPVCEPWNGPVGTAFVVPLDPLGPRGYGGMLIFGVSPRLSFDDDYRGFLMHLVENVQDSLARVRAKRTHQHVESERRNLLMQAPVAAALMVGPELRYELANPRYVEMVDREVEGKAYLEAFPEVQGTELERVLFGAYERGEPYTVEEMRVPLLNAKTGVLVDRYFQFALEPIRGGYDTVVGLMVVGVDISEQVRARKARDRAHEQQQAMLSERAALVEQLETASRAKDEFLAMLGHELRNPLAPIVTALELLGVSGKGEGREYELIARQVGHLVRLVDDLLDVTRIARGSIEIKREEIDLRTVVDKAIEMASPLLEQRGHRLSTNVARGLLWVGDPVRLAQVFANLLTNAARYTPAGGTVEIEATVERDEVRVTVSDTGNGIAPDQLDAIFEVFTQGPRAIDRADGGLGLGLTLARTLVELHGGTISARSAGIGQGSTFEVRLGRSSIDAVSTPTREAVADDSVRVLIVDDNEDAAELLAATFFGHGHVVEVAHDGPSALKVLQRFEPQVAVLDIGLPIMDGYELAKRVRAMSEAVLLIAVTGYGQASDRARSAEAGFDAHLVKPVAYRELADVIAAIRQPSSAQQ